MSLALRRLLLGAACLVLSLAQIIQSASVFAAAGLVIGLFTGCALFHFARQLGRVRAIPRATWQDLYRMNTNGSSVVGASVGAALGIFLAGALSVAAPSAQDVFWNWLLGAVAGFAFSLRFSAIGGSAVRID
jgi:hypothetical protein